MEAFQKWSSWLRQLQILGFDYEDSALLESLQRAFANYVKHNTERCYEHDFGSISDMMRLAKANEVMGNLLGTFGQSEAFDFVDKCSTFTLEMDSTMDTDLNTCMLLDAGNSDVDETSHVTAEVEIRVQNPAPWSGPMQWESASYAAECHLPGRNGGDLITCHMSFAGLGPADQFAVVGAEFDLNNINRPPPPPSPQPAGSPGASGAPGPSVAPTPKPPPTPTPTEPPEETISELKFKKLMVQPGDPQILYDGDCRVFGFSGGSETSRGSGNWLATWRDMSAPLHRRMVDLPDFGDAYELSGWDNDLDADVVARLEYGLISPGLFGTLQESTTFILRHTPRR